VNGCLTPGPSPFRRGEHGRDVGDEEAVVVAVGSRPARAIAVSSNGETTRALRRYYELSAPIQSRTCVILSAAKNLVVRSRRGAMGSIWLALVGGLTPGPSPFRRGEHGRDVGDEEAVVVAVGSRPARAVAVSSNGETTRALRRYYELSAPIRSRTCVILSAAKNLVVILTSGVHVPSPSAAACPTLCRSPLS